MSTKGNKRRQKRLNTHDDDGDTEKQKRENEKVEQNGAKPEKNTEKVICLDVENGDTVDLKGFTVDEVIIVSEPPPPPPPPEVEDVKNDVEIETVEPSLDSQVSVTDSQKSSKDDTESLEPLVLDVEDPELQFPESASETSDLEKSPFVNRCMTRRSTMHISLKDLHEPEEYNGTDQDSFTDKIDTDIENASTVVNYTGNDTTHNTDVAQLNETVTETASFAENNKERSYSDILRNLSGRKAMRMHDSFRFEVRDVPDVFRSPGRTFKRKFVPEEHEEPKRFKEDPSPSLLSYISSPLYSFKRRLSRELPSSTPKLTSFKHRATAVDQLSVDAGPEHTQPKKWCSIM